MDSKARTRPKDSRKARDDQLFGWLPPEVQADPEIQKIFGLGDAVAAVASPVAKALGIKDCAPCRKRQEKLNRLSSAAESRIRNLFRPKARSDTPKETSDQNDPASSDEKPRREAT